MAHHWRNERRRNWLGGREEGESEPDTDLYAVLNVSKDASIDELRQSYFNLARTYHPDKLQPGLREAARSQFNRIRDAYEVLTNPQQREVYDVYGLDGLKAGTEVGERLQTRDEILSHFEKERRKQADLLLQTRIRHNGTFSMGFAAWPYFKSGAPIRISSMSCSTAILAPLSSHDNLTLGGSISQRLGKGAGVFFLNYQRNFDGVTAESTLSVGPRPVLTQSFTQRLSPFLETIYSADLSMVDGAFAQSMTLRRTLSEHTRAEGGFTVGGDPGVAVSWTHQKGKWGVQGGLRWTTHSIGVTGSATRNLSENSHARVAMKLGSMGIEFDIGGMHRISDNSIGGMSCTIGLMGILWRFRFYRGGQRFVVPVLLWPRLRWDAALIALLVPPLVISIAKFLAFDPLSKRRAARKTLMARRSNAEKVRDARQEAADAILVMASEAARKRALEEERNGLVILYAVWGASTPEVAENEELMMRGRRGEAAALEDDGGAAAAAAPASPGPSVSPGNGSDGRRAASVGRDELPAPYWVVTVPLQYLARDGYLKLNADISKSSLTGFCDPCPGEPKKLLVRYNSHGRRHQVTVSELEELTLPSDNHRVRDEAS